MSGEERKSNAQTIDNNSSQSLFSEDVQRLKQRCTGEQLHSSLRAAHHSSKGLSSARCDVSMAAEEF